jgi:hypothetical protein
MVLPQSAGTIRFATASFWGKTSEDTVGERNQWRSQT